MTDALAKINDADYRCRACGTLVKPGQTHYALKPKPHASLAALIVREKLPTLEASDAQTEDCFSMRYFASEIEDKAVRDTSGRKVTGTLIYDADAMVWRESK